MDLIQMQKKVQEKDNQRNKLLGQQEMLMNGLKDLGFSSIISAKKKSVELTVMVNKMKAHYQKGEEKFKEEYEHLLT
jgi:hypothetical protein